MNETPIVIACDKSNGKDFTSYCVASWEKGFLEVHGVFDNAEDAFIELWKLEALNKGK